MQLNIESEEKEDLVVLKAKGEVDVYTAPALKEAVLAALAKANSIAFDLSETSYIDSTGLSVLIGALKRTKSQDGRVVILNPHPNVRKILEITGLDRALPIEDHAGPQ